MVMIGVERERFIVDGATGRIVSAIGSLLPLAQHIAGQQGVGRGRFTYELYAGQVEDKTPPCHNLEKIAQELRCNDAILDLAASELGIGYDHSEFILADQIDCLSVNPFSQRHQTIWQGLDPDIRLAASAVAAVHVHIAVDRAVAAGILNRCRREVIDRLIALGDHSGGQRIVSYRQMAGSDGIPPLFTSYEALKAYIELKGGEKNVWDLVRFKPSTRTIEFRMFGATSNISEILGYIQACLEVVE